MIFNATMIGQGIAFAFFVWFCMKYVWPPIIDILEQRQTRIADGLAAAERAQTDIQLAQENAAEKLIEAKVEAASIIDKAGRDASLIIEESKQRAREEGDNLISLAKAEIKQETNRAKEQLRQHVPELAVASAERILEKTVDKAANEDLLNNLGKNL